jgi:AcrR family transcriptional regulator
VVIAAPIKSRRAIEPADKLSRREAILDAAGLLVAQNLNHLPSVDQVAQAASLAKGTLYLYFESKEAIYLALHQRQTQTFFSALLLRLKSNRPFTRQALLNLIDTHMLNVASFFPLCASCMSVAIHEVDPATVQRFHQDLGQWLFDAGRLLEIRISKLRAGDGVRMLHLGYAQMIGLYQLLGNSAGDAKVMAHLRQQQQALGLGSFEFEARAAISLIWQQAVLEGLPRPKAARSTATKKTILGK